MAEILKLIVFLENVKPFNIKQSLDRVLKKLTVWTVFNGKMWPLNSKPFEWLGVQVLPCVQQCGSPS